MTRIDPDAHLDCRTRFNKFGLDRQRAAASPDRVILQHDRSPKGRHYTVAKQFIDGPAMPRDSFPALRARIAHYGIARLELLPRCRCGRRHDISEHYADGSPVPR